MRFCVVPAGICHRSRSCILALKLSKLLYPATSRESVHQVGSESTNTVCQHDVVMPPSCWICRWRPRITSRDVLQHALHERWQIWEAKAVP